MKENVIRATVYVHDIDRYEGETEDILKKIAEAGEEPKKTEATKKAQEKFLQNDIKEIEFKLLAYKYFSEIIPMENICKIIDMGFCTAPASTKYHGNFEGGLLAHSLEVTTALVSLTLDLGLEWGRKESPVIVGLFHDLCKIDSYIKQEDGSYMYNPEAPKGHGTKSVEYIEKYLGLELTNEEKACIIYHMGAFTDKEEWKDYTAAIHKYPNVLYTHTADMIASHIKDV